MRSLSQASVRKSDLSPRDSWNERDYRARGRVTKWCLLCALSLALASCGPSLEQQEQTGEAQRLRRAATSEQALATFAESHGATPVEIFELDLGRRPFTAQLQDKLEGSVVAFRGWLLDIVRTPTGDGEYDLIFADPILGGTLVTLSTSEQDAAKLLTMSAEEPPTLLARKIHEGADFGRDTKASAWYKAVATRAFSTTEAFDCATTRYHRLFSSLTSLIAPSWPRRACRRLGPAGRVASADRHARPPRLAPHRPRAWRADGITSRSLVATFSSLAPRGGAVVPIR